MAEIREVLFRCVVLVLLMSCLNGSFLAQNAVLRAPYPNEDELLWTYASPKRIKDLHLQPQNSPWVISLEGEWDFAWKESQGQYLNQVEQSHLNWDRVIVPGNWQLLSKYDPPQFGNGNQDNEKEYLGIYRKEFRIPPQWRGGSIFLRINGSGQEARVNLNGQVLRTVRTNGLGFEIELLPGLIRPINTLVIQLPHQNTRFSNDNYSWKLNGLDRGIFLFCQKGTQIREVGFQADGQGFYRLRVDLLGHQARGRKNEYLAYRLIDIHKNVISEEKIKIKPTASLEEFRFEGKLPYVYYWSAEVPNMYSLEIWLEDHKNQLTNYTSRQVGFRTPLLDQNSFKINGKIQKIKGIRYRGFSPREGYAISPQELERDLRLIKANHINAIYLKNPAPAHLYEFCERIGLYIISNLGDGSSPSFRESQRRWESHFASVILHVYEGTAPKTRSDIPLLSLEKLKEESLFFEPDLTLGDARPAFSAIEMLKPINILGAWADQTIYFPSKEGTQMLTYQGSTRAFGWKYPQLIDGVVDANRKPQPELEQLKKLYAPVQIKCREDHLILQHDYAFIPLSKISLFWRLEGEEGSRDFRSKLPPYFPNFIYKINYPFEEVKNGECLQVWARPISDEEEFSDAEILGEDNYCLQSLPEQYKPSQTEGIRILESITNLDITTSLFSLSFDKGVNMLQSIRIGRDEILASPPSFRFYEEESINDKISLIQKNTRKVHDTEECHIFLDEITIDRGSRDNISIVYRGKLYSEENLRYDLKARYALNSMGEIKVDFWLRPLGQSDEKMIEQVWEIDLDRGFVNWKTPFSIPENRSISNFQYPFLIPLYPQRKADASWIEISPLDQNWNLIFVSEKLPPFSITNVRLEDWYQADYNHNLHNTKTSSLSLGPIEKDAKSDSFHLSYSLLLDLSKI